MFKFLRKLNGIQLWTVIIVLLAIVGVNQQLFSSNGKAIDDIDYTASSEVSQETDAFAAKETDSDTYTVREHNGGIAVFAGDDPEPIITENTKVNMLPKDDQKLLADGIKFTSYREMIEFLQNYE